MKQFYEYPKQVLLYLKGDKLSYTQDGVLHSFEKSFASFFGTKYAIGSCNGTLALQAALFGIDLQKGDEVILPANSYISAVNPILSFHAKPIFSDIDYDSGTMTVDEIKKHLSNKTKAVIIHQPWGNIAQMDEIYAFLSKKNIFVLSDSSHAHGATYHNKPLGHFADVVFASLGRSKLISGGELGIICTNDNDIRDRMIFYGHPHRTDYSNKKYLKYGDFCGLKIRPTTIAMKLALEQLLTFDRRHTLLKKNAQILQNEIKKTSLFALQSEFDYCERSYWKLSLRVNSVKQKIPILQKAKEIGLDLKEVESYFSDLGSYSLYTQFFSVVKTKTPKAKKLAKSELILNCLNYYDKSELKRAIEQIHFLDSFFANE